MSLSGSSASAKISASASTAARPATMAHCVAPGCIAAWATALATRARRPHLACSSAEQSPTQTSTERGSEGGEPTTGLASPGFSQSQASSPQSPQSTGRDGAGGGASPQSQASPQALDSTGRGAAGRAGRRARHRAAQRAACTAAEPRVAKAMEQPDSRMGGARSACVEIKFRAPQAIDAMLSS